jgi:hypothetical protein
MIPQTARLVKLVIERTVYIEEIRACKHRPGFAGLRRSGPTCRGGDLAVTKVPVTSVPFRGKERPAGVAAVHPFNPLRTNRKQLSPGEFWCAGPRWP